MGGAAGEEFQWWAPGARVDWVYWKQSTQRSLSLENSTTPHLEACPRKRWSSGSIGQENKSCGWLPPALTTPHHTPTSNAGDESNLMVGEGGEAPHC